ncbi:MAG: endonuclease Q family protein [Methanomicrobiales archaeon]|nr:endonuclease Q family protein [Methanomicrobiales archaeon]
MLVNADLHIHSPFSIGTSRTMDLEQLYSACMRKGLQVMGSGDALHPIWRERCRHIEERDDFLLLPTAEVEDEHRIHHLILLSDFSSSADLAVTLSPHSKNILTSGRPHIAATGEVIAREVHRQGGLIGPAHAFTPWTSLFARFDHIQDCYGGEEPDFLELGLSADSGYAAGIPDLATVTFLSNSDAHSAETVKIGREWNRLRVARLTAPAILESISRGRIEYNAGLFPGIGKYNRTACSRCYHQYSREEALALRWRCPDDGGRIKKGVSDRVQELSTVPPGSRPPYYHRTSLGEIIQQELGTSSPYTRRCRALYDRLVETFGNEIAILMETPVSEIRSLDEGVAESIRSLRSGEIGICPGGGGRYGTFLLKSKDYGIHPTTDHNAENS